MATPMLPNIQALIAAGIDPKTGLPAKLANSSQVKESIVRQLRIVDEQDAVNRYVWFGLPHGINSNLIERILYYKGQGMLFYMETEDKFYFLPFALDGGIDVYGRYQSVTPVPLGNSSNEDKVKPWIQGLSFKPYYDILIDDSEIYDAMTQGCVILTDYSRQISQTVLPRQAVNDPILDIMADLIPYMRTALMNSTGIDGMRVGSEDEQSNVAAASLALQQAALRGDKWMPIVGQLDFQTLTSGAVAKSEEFLLALQALDNYRLSLYGMDNGGLFQKKSHMLEAEQRMNTGNSGIIMDDGLKRRQEFADISNSIWGTSIVVEVNETLTGADTNGDMMLGGFQDNNPGGLMMEPAPATQTEEESSNE